VSYVRFSGPINGAQYASKRFNVRVDSDQYVEADVQVENRYLLARCMVARGGEADLALCLSALVAVGVLDVEKLRAALVLAEPVAREAVEAGKHPADSKYELDWMRWGSLAIGGVLATYVAAYAMVSP